MKTIITVLVLFITTAASAQNCICDKDTMLKEIISCDTIKFDNKAKLFWSFNCDSSWLTFENSQKQKTIIFTIEPYFTNRLGHIYRQEYKSTFLMQHNVISGCCDPPIFYLYDKKNGQFKRDCGRILFYSEDKKLPVIVSFTNSNYDQTTKENYNFITVYNIDNNKKHFIKLPKGQIDKILRKTNDMYPEHLFIEPVLKGSILKLSYWINQSKTITKTIIIDLSKHKD